MIDFDDDIILEDGRVQLKPLQKKHLKHLSPFALNEPDIWTYSLALPNSEAKMTTYISKALDGREAEEAYPFIVFDKLKNTYAGSTRFYDINAHHKSCSLGYTWYGNHFQGTGLNTHCKFLLLKFAFENWHLERVEFRADNRNSRSIKAMKNLGATAEGVLRSNCSAPNGRRDSIVLSILKNEWFERVKPLLLNRMNTE